MKKFASIILALAIIAAIFILAILFTSSPGGQPGPETKIAATIFPIYDIAKNVAGEQAEVVLITPPGASPHTFEITASEIRKLQGTDVLFAIGQGLDEWITETRNAIPGSRVKTVDQGIVLRHLEEDESVEPEENDEHQHEGADPHYWLSINNAKKIAQTIRDTLIEIDPQNAAQYSNNTINYIGELETAEQEINGILKDLPNRQIITMHNAWGYFAEEFNLEIVATFEPFPGREPTPQYLAELSRTAEQFNIRTIFSEPQLSNQALIPFLNDLNMDLAVLDPVGGFESRDSYINLMKYNAQTIQEKLQ